MRYLLVMALVVFGVLLPGCGGDNGGRVPAVGVVTFEGAPLADVYVTFRPDDGEAGNGGFAITDDEGRFEIYYPDTGTGLVPSRYKVTITPPPTSPGEGRPVVAPLRPSNKPGEGGYPSVYSSPENTPLRVTVTPTAEILKVELLSNPGKAPVSS